MVFVDLDSDDLTFSVFGFGGVGASDVDEDIASTILDCTVSSDFFYSRQTLHQRRISDY
jgi:hypothetical protein